MSLISSQCGTKLCGRYITYAPYATMKYRFLTVRHTLHYSMIPYRVGLHAGWSIARSVSVSPHWPNPGAYQDRFIHTPTTYVHTFTRHIIVPSCCLTCDLKHMLVFDCLALLPYNHFLYCTCYTIAMHLQVCVDSSRRS